MNHHPDMEINWREYQLGALRTESTPAVLRANRSTLAGLVMLATSGARALDLLKKHLFYGRPIDEGKLWDLLEGVSRGTIAAKCSTPNENLEVIHTNGRLLHAIIGKVTESGELLEALAAEKLDLVNVKEELGDSAWYDAVLVDELQRLDGSVNYGDILATNLAKLKARYPDRFTAEAAEHRDLDRERQVLER